LREKTIRRYLEKKKLNRKRGPEMTIKEKTRTRRKPTSYDDKRRKEKTREKKTKASRGKIREEGSKKGKKRESEGESLNGDVGH